MKRVLSFVWLLCSLSFIGNSESVEMLVNKLNDVKEGEIGRALLDNNFEDGSMNPWSDASSGYVAWQVEETSRPFEANSSAPSNSASTRHLRVNRVAITGTVESGLSVLKSIAFTALPGDQISFDFWIRSKRLEANNLEVNCLIPI